jgi:hypothetical protein
VTVQRRGRRNFLRGVGGITLSLPFLEAFAGGGSSLRNFIVFLNGQGTCLRNWVTGCNTLADTTNFTLGPILQPLQDYHSRLLPIYGIDNKIHRYHVTGGHTAGPMTLLTGDAMSKALDENGDLLLPVSAQPQTEAVDHASAPSIDQVLAERLVEPGAYRSIDLCVGPSGTHHYQYVGKDDPVYSEGNPVVSFESLFTTTDESVDLLRAERERRRSVLDSVLGNFGSLRAKVGRDDKQRLDAHAQKIRDMEEMLQGDPKVCSPPTLSLERPAWRTFDTIDHGGWTEKFNTGYDYRIDDDVSAVAQIQILAMAIACGQARVGSIFFANSHDPFLFRGLTLPNGQNYVEGYEGWHDMVHIGRGEENAPPSADAPGLVAGFRFYAEQFARLLAELESFESASGTLLDETMVMWTSEFGNGYGHNTQKIPFLFAGNCGPGGGGRFLNRGLPNTYDDSPYTQNHVYTSVLRAFGFDDERFGRPGPDYDDSGALPGLG